MRLALDANQENHPNSNNVMSASKKDAQKEKKKKTKIYEEAMNASQGAPEDEELISSSRNLIERHSNRSVEICERIDSDAKKIAPKPVRSHSQMANQRQTQKLPHNVVLQPQGQVMLV